jgi:hypothetical protein
MIAGRRRRRCTTIHAGLAFESLAHEPLYHIRRIFRRALPANRPLLGYQNVPRCEIPGAVVVKTMRGRGAGYRFNSRQTSSSMWPNPDFVRKLACGSSSRRSAASEGRPGQHRRSIRSSPCGAAREQPRLCNEGGPGRNLRCEIKSRPRERLAG